MGPERKLWVSTGAQPGKGSNDSRGDQTSRFKVNILQVLCYDWGFFFFFTRFWGTRSLNYLRSLLQEKECEFKIRHTALEVPQRFSFITFIVNPLTSWCESWSLLQYLSPKRGMNQQLCQDTCRPSGSYLEFCVSIMCLKVHSARTKHDLSDGLCSVIPEMRPWDQELW